MEHHCKTPEQIREDLKRISPLALPAYLMNCELGDQRDIEDVLEKATREFKENGGVARSLMDVMLPTSVQAVSMALLKKFNAQMYAHALKGKINFGVIVQQVASFQYDQEFLAQSKGGDELLHINLKRDASEISDKYNRKEWDNDSRKNEFKAEYQEDVDVIGQKVYSSQAEADAAGASGKDILTADHIVPLKQISDTYGSFAQRWVGQDKMNKIVNSNENFQALNQSSNSSKNDMTAEEWIAAQKERLVRKNDDPERQRREKAIKSEDRLKANERDAKRHLHREFLNAGSKTVLWEQIGKIVETIVGPVFFEIRESFSKGFCYGCDTDSVAVALAKRTSRVLEYIFLRLPKLIGDLIGDFSQMLIHLALSISNIFTGILKRFKIVILSGISVVIEAVKVCCSKNMSSKQKGDAILKLFVALVVNVIGNFALESLLSSWEAPEVVIDIVPPLVSAVLSAIILHFFDKLDLFNIKRDIRKQRIREIFELRAEEIRRNTAAFDILATERLKEDRIRFEELKSGMAQMLAEKDFGNINARMDQFAEFLHVTIPYKNAAEFADMLRQNSIIEIKAPAV